MLTKDDFNKLLEHGLSYRYPLDRWIQLRAGDNMPFSSPQRKVGVNGSTMVEELIQPILHPVYLKEEDQKFFERLAKSWHEVMCGLYQVAYRHSGQNTECGCIVRHVLGVQCDTQAFAKTGYPDYPTPFLRLDMVRDGNGQFKTIDINTTRPAGVGDCMVLANMFAKLGMGIQYPYGEVFSGVVQKCFAQWSATYAVGQQARMVVVVDEQAGDWHNFRILSEALKTKPWVQKIVMMSNAPKPGDKEFNLVIRGRIKQGHPEYDALRKLPVSQYCIISPLGHRWLGSKNWFVYLHNPVLKKELLHRVSQEALETVCASLPPSGILRYDGTIQFNDKLEQVTSLSRDQWLIKPPAGSSGKGILMGRSMSRGRWEEAIKDPINHGAILQQYYRYKERFTVLNEVGRPEEKDFYVKYGAFLYGGAIAGVEVMARREPLVHGARNTYFTVCTKGEG